MTQGPTPAPPAALEATGLGVRFRRRGPWALRDCDFTVPAGSVCAVVGPNGAGKSTLFGLAADLLAPTAGQLRVLGFAPDDPAVRERLAFVAQDKPLYPRWTVAETLRFGRLLNNNWDQETAERLVRAGDIPLDGRVGSLSGGARTRIALALALGSRPELLLLDEPLSDLDPLVREEIAGTLMAQAAEHGTTVVLSTHVLPDVEHACDHLLVLSGGRVHLTGDAEELREDHLLLTGPTAQPAPRPTEQPPAELDGHHVVHSRTVGRQFTALVRRGGPAAPESRQVRRPALEDVLLGHLRAAARADSPAHRSTQESA